MIGYFDEFSINSFSLFQKIDKEVVEEFTYNEVSLDSAMNNAAENVYEVYIEDKKKKKSF